MALYVGPTHFIYSVYGKFLTRYGCPHTRDPHMWKENLWVIAIFLATKPGK